WAKRFVPAKSTARQSVSVLSLIGFTNSVVNAFDAAHCKEVDSVRIYKKRAPMARSLLFNKINLNVVRNNSRLDALVQQSPDAFASPLAVIERQVVYPHRHEPVRQLRRHIPCELHRVGE